MSDEFDLNIQSASESVDDAVRVFHTFDDGVPDLIPIGIRAVDRRIGGQSPGSAGILAASTGVGKSRVILAAALNCPARTGVISLEDTADVVGTRLLGYVAGVDSMKLRTKTFDPTEGRRMKLAVERIREDPELNNFRVSYNVGGTLDEVETSIKSLVQDHGCQRIWVDYIQKIRGGSDDRRNEVSFNYTRIQRVCDRLKVPVMVISQFSRQPDMTRLPQIYWLKESGDLENEARLIVLCHRDPAEPLDVIARVAKSTYGGEGIRAHYQPDVSGMLVEIGND